MKITFRLLYVWYFVIFLMLKIKPTSAQKYKVLLQLSDTVPIVSNLMVLSGSGSIHYSVESNSRTFFLDRRPSIRSFNSLDTEHHLSVPNSKENSFLFAGAKSTRREFPTWEKSWSSSTRQLGSSCRRISCSSSELLPPSCSSSELLRPSCSSNEFPPPDQLL
jgi:hypothetical protein